jgi:hypothetical protein
MDWCEDSRGLMYEGTGEGEFRIGTTFEIGKVRANDVLRSRGIAILFNTFRSEHETSHRNACLNEYNP